MVVVAAMVAIQYVSTRQESPQKLPGTARGDLVLQQDVLPKEIHGWRQTAFEPAKPPELLPEGQFWWTHIWHYTNGTQRCIVTFDQADWTVWHELTMCYEAIGWTLVDRQVLEVVDLNYGHWPLVLASLEKSKSEKATLIFSQFDQGGAPLTIPFRGMPQKRKTAADPNLIRDFANRLNYKPGPKSSMIPGKVTLDRVLQCQVLIQHQGDLPAATLEEIVELHQQTLVHFRSAWIAHQTRQNTVN
jgi:hypothetical protein